jgi:cyclic pyranopterin phosphate synthase
MSKKLTHLDAAGNPSMVDVGAKNITVREAIAQSIVWLPKEVMDLLLKEDKTEIQTKKGPVFQTATIAGIMAVKQTSNLIPLCHPLIIDKIKVDVQFSDYQEIIIKCTVKNTGKTGVEMEALTGASVAALTIYDMCKAMSHEIVIKETKLIRKTGGKSDFFNEE